MHPVSCTNTHHGITDLVNHGVVKKYKNSKISSTEHNFSIKQKKSSPVPQIVNFGKLSFCSGSKL